MNDIISIIKKSKAAYFSTVDADGKPEIRALLNLANPKKYRKFVGKALLQDSFKGVCLSGTIEEVLDSAI